MVWLAKPAASPIEPVPVTAPEPVRAEAPPPTTTPTPPAIELPTTAAEHVAAAEDLSTRAFRVGDLFEPPAPAAVPAGPPSAAESRPTAEEPHAARPAEPSGRTLADLYSAQGHYAEALRIYDDLIEASPFDPELKRLRRDAEARLLPAASTPALAAPDSGLTRRLAKVRALKRWLAVVQTG
jgi:hypothetical protein